MDAKVFIQMVKKMREHQRAYFKYRQQRDLIPAKELEKQVDQALLDGITFEIDHQPIVEQVEKQAGLFE